MKNIEKKFDRIENLVQEELENLLSEQGVGGETGTTANDAAAIFRQYTNLPDEALNPRKLSYANKMKFVMKAYKKIKDDADDAQDHLELLRQLFSKTVASRLINSLNAGDDFKDVDGAWLDRKRTMAIFTVLMSGFGYRPVKTRDLILPAGLAIKEIPQIPRSVGANLQKARREFALNMVTGREAYGGARDSRFFRKAMKTLEDTTGLDGKNFENLFDEGWDSDMQQKNHLASARFTMDMAKLIRDENNRIKILKAQEYDLMWDRNSKSYTKRGAPAAPAVEFEKASDENAQPKIVFSAGDSDDEPDDKPVAVATPVATQTKTAKAELPKLPAKKPKVTSAAASKTKYKLSDYDPPNPKKGADLGVLVSKLQKKLQQLGTYTGQIDSVFGKGTSKALRAAYFVHNKS